MLSAVRGRRNPLVATLMSSWHRQAVAADLIQPLHEVHAREFEVEVLIDVGFETEVFGLPRSAS